MFYFVIIFQNFWQTEETSFKNKNKNLTTPILSMIVFFSTVTHTSLFTLDLHEA